MPRRGKRHYTEVWAEEDGTLSRDTPEQDGLPPNQPRGSLEQMDDDTAETDQVSSGPLMNRLLSTLCASSIALPQRIESKSTASRTAMEKLR